MSLLWALANLIMPASHDTPSVGAHMVDDSMNTHNTPCDTISHVTSLRDTSVSPHVSKLFTMMLACYAAQPFYTAIPSCINDTFDMAFHTAYHQPVSYAAAMRSSQVTQWMAAMDEEKQAFFDNGA